MLEQQQVRFIRQVRLGVSPLLLLVSGLSLEVLVKAFRVRHFWFEDHRCAEPSMPLVLERDIVREFTQHNFRSLKQSLLQFFQSCRTHTCTLCHNNTINSPSGAVLSIHSAKALKLSSMLRE
jgi:hypothetical protein